MEHEYIDLINNHKAHRFEYADAAARIAEATLDVNNVGKLAIQLDDGSVWRLTGITPAVWKWVGFRNNAGQIKANYGTSLSVTGVSSGTPSVFNINAATSTLSSFPTTTYPFSAPSQTYAAMFDSTRGSSPTGRLIENPIGGQFNTWRVQGSYANKPQAQTGNLKIRLRNPVSGFIYEQIIPLINGITTDTWNAVLVSIADNVSIPAPNGYVLDTLASFTDPNIIIYIASITRVSAAVDYGVKV